MKITETFAKIITLSLLLCGCSTLSDAKGIFTELNGNNNGQFWTVKRAPDGDTITVTSGSQEMKVRFCGIDAPETKHGAEPGQPFGYEARDYLRSLLDKANRKVLVTKIETDRYGRTVGEIFTRVNGVDSFINEEMVKAGFAYHYSRYSGNCPNKIAIENAESIAKSKRIGVWSNPSLEKPWDYRKRVKSR